MSSEDSPPQQAQSSVPADTDAGLGDNRSRIGDVGATIADGAGAVLSAARAPLDSLTSGARRVINERPGARVRRVRRLARQELPNLWELHPEARRASLRELGIVLVPVDEIRGTAVEGPGQRGGDFLPLHNRRSDDWRARWQRILRALDRLESLPPVELLKFDGGYWVVDGHNRVAAALYNGQIELDAVVQELRMPGDQSSPPPTLAPVLEGSLDLRAAGSGRLTKTAQRPTDLGSVPRHEHSRAGEHEQSPPKHSPPSEQEADETE